MSVDTAIAFALVGVFGVATAGRRPALLLAVVLGGLIWVFGEAFGEIATGRATDPNSGPCSSCSRSRFGPGTDGS